MLTETHAINLVLAKAHKDDSARTLAWKAVNEIMASNPSTGPRTGIINRWPNKVVWAMQERIARRLVKKLRQPFRRKPRRKAKAAGKREVTRRTGRR